MDPDDGRVVSNFINQALDGKPLTIYGSGFQTRSFCYVDDLIRGFVKVKDTNDDFTGPMNLGNPVEFTVGDLAKQVCEKIGGHIQYEPLPIDDPTRRRPDITLAKRVLDWEPQVTLDEGLNRTIEYFKLKRQSVKS